MMTGDASVEVVDDEPAYIDYQSSDRTASDGETVEVVTVMNRGSDVIEVTDVTIVDGDAMLTNTTSPNTISPGEMGAIQATVDCTPPQTRKITVTVAVAANGEGFGAHLSGDTKTRGFSLNCVETGGKNGGDKNNEDD